MIRKKQPLRSLMLSLIMLLPLSLLAQEIKVQGVVKDQTGEAVIGATVMQKGTTLTETSPCQFLLKLLLPFPI